jgi:hypothetical protein
LGIFEKANLSWCPYLPLKRLGVVELVAASLEVLARMRTAALLAGQRTLHDLHGVDEQVLQLQRLHQVAVPHHRAVRHLHVRELIVYIVDLALGCVTT